MERVEINIVLQFEAKVIGKANFITVTNQDSYKLVSFYNLNLNNNIYAKKGSIIYVDIFIGECRYTDLELIVVNDITMDSENSFFETIFDAELYSYDQFQIDLMKDWNEGKRLRDWQNLKQARKYDWIRTTSHYTEWGNQEKLRDNIVINGSLVKCKEDFYCHLGEAFYKGIGYLGGTLDGIDDCLDFFRFSKTQKRVITVQHLEQLKKILNKKRADYLDIVFEIFEKHGFIIQIE